MKLLLTLLLVGSLVSTSTAVARAEGAGSASASTVTPAKKHVKKGRVRHPKKPHARPSTGNAHPSGGKRSTLVAPLTK